MTVPTTNQTPATSEPPNPSADLLSRPDDDRPSVVLAQRLTKVFKDFWMRRKVAAVNQLNLDIKQGEVFGLIGPNGSGKSTTIKLILGLLHKTGGRLAVFGKPPENVLAKKRIGYLPEDSYLYPFLNARETLDFYGRLFSLSRPARMKRIDELLEMVGLDAVQFRPIGEYSKGMQRRIGIAQALINDPDFLILDEPTSGLDPIGIRQVKDLILHLGRRGKTILLSSHLLADVEDVCDYMVILYGGRKQLEGARGDLLTTHDRTVIETEALDPARVEQIRRYIEQTEHRQVLNVAPARQSLESLFLDIVDRAQSEKLETFGAKSGGQTAAFLRSGADISSTPGEAEGDALLEELTKIEEPKPARSQPADSAEPSAKSHASRLADSVGVDSSVLESLAVDSADDKHEEDESTLNEKSSTDLLGKSPKTEVDTNVLESLLDAYGDSDDPHKKNQDPAPNGSDPNPDPNPDP